jgi:outer membrane lipoprotein SlyB
MCLRIVLWSGLLGFAGGAAGVYAGSEIWPGNFRAPAYAMIVGAVAGSAIGAGAVCMFGRREPGD